MGVLDSEADRAPRTRKLHRMVGPEAERRSRGAAEAGQRTRERGHHQGAKLAHRIELLSSSQAGATPAPRIPEDPDPDFDAVLVGYRVPIRKGGRERLRELVASFPTD